MNVPPFTASEILAQLDECARAFTFPMLDNGYVYPADVWLTAFSDNTRWALVIECVGAHPRAGGHDSIYDCLHGFGNCLRRVPGTANEDLLGRTSDGEDGPIFDDEYDWYVNEGVRKIRIRDTLVALHLGPETLAKKGIFLEDPPRINGAELLRSLLPEYRDLFLATDTELRERIPADLPVVLQLDEACANYIFVMTEKFVEPSL